MTAGAAPGTPSAPIQPAVLGRELGRYTLLGKLAAGGMAEIFLARQQGVQGFEKLVVVKRILASFSEDPEFVTMFLEEGRLAGQLSHPNVVQTFDLGEDHGTYFIAMEYIAGESLSMLARQARLKGASLDPRLAARLISQAAEGLDYAHRKTDILGKPLNIVHRDISPQNLLVTYEGMMKVVDFGIARASTRASHTGEGQVRGKLAYMAPEQLMEDGVIDGRSDLFSLGVVLFEMVTGTRLVEGGDAARTVNMLCGTAPLPTAGSRRPGLDPALDAIISKAMTRQVTQRYQSGGEFHRALEQWLATAGPVSAAEISELMRDLFAQRMAERQQLIEKAVRGELDTGGATQPAAPSSEGSMPDRRNSTAVLYAALLKRWRILAVGATALGLVVGLAGYFNSSGTKAPPVVVAGAELPLASHSRRPLIQLTTPVSAAPALPVTLPAKLVSDAGPVPQPTPPLAVKPVAPLPVSTPGVAALAAEDPGGNKSKSHGKHGLGKLTIDTTPWTEVYFRGKDLGQTPLFEIALPAGTQRLVLKNPGESVDQTIEVEIESGKVNTQKLHL